MVGYKAESGRGSEIRSLGLTDTHTTTYEIDNQQGPTAHSRSNYIQL